MFDDLSNASTFLGSPVERFSQQILFFNSRVLPVPGHSSLYPSQTHWKFVSDDIHWLSDIESVLCFVRNKGSGTVSHLILLSHFNPIQPGLFGHSQLGGCLVPPSVIP